MSADALRVSRLLSGYWLIRGDGPCEWAQPRHWPCSDAELDAATFPEASPAFRAALRRGRDLVARLEPR